MIVVRRVRALIRHLTGADVRAMRVEIAELRTTVEAMSRVVMDLNHDVRSGAESSLPLFLGYLERLRLDADTAVAAVEVIERQLAEMRTIADHRSN